jgi:hypothetical protein
MARCGFYYPLVGMIYVNLERGDSGDPATVDEAVRFLPQTL